MQPPSNVSRYHQLLEMEAVESGCEGCASSRCSSEDDSSDLSYIVEDEDAILSPGMHAIYMQSLGSQGEELGFGTPMHQKRRREQEDDDCAPSCSIITGILNRHDAKMRLRLSKKVQSFTPSCLLPSPSAARDFINLTPIPISLAHPPVSEIRRDHAASVFAGSYALPQPLLKGSGVFSSRCKLKSGNKSAPSAFTTLDPQSSGLGSNLQP